MGAKIWVQDEEQNAGAGVGAETKNDPRTTKNDPRSTKNGLEQSFCPPFPFGG